MPPRGTADYTAEIAEALHASDAQRLARIAMELLVIAGTALDRRERDRLRKQGARPIPRKSTESAEIHGPGGMRSSRSFSLDESLEEKDSTASAEIRGNEQPDELVLQRMDLLRGAVGDADWPDVDAFIRRRPYYTWKGWSDEMASLIGPGSQFLPCDLVRVCRDDAALSRPIGSPKGLRIFLADARVVRVREREGLSAMSPSLINVNGRPTRAAIALHALNGDKPV